MKRMREAIHLLAPPASTLAMIAAAMVFFASATLSVVFALLTGLAILIMVAHLVNAVMMFRGAKGSPARRWLYLFHDLSVLAVYSVLPAAGAFLLVEGPGDPAGFLVLGVMLLSGTAIAVLSLASATLSIAATAFGRYNSKPAKASAISTGLVFLAVGLIVLLSAISPYLLAVAALLMLAGISLALAALIRREPVFTLPGQIPGVAPWQTQVATGYPGYSAPDVDSLP